MFQTVSLYIKKEKHKEIWRKKNFIELINVFSRSDHELINYLVEERLDTRIIYKMEKKISKDFQLLIIDKIPSKL